MDFCDKGTGYGFAWWIFAPGCSSMSTGFVFHIHRVPAKRSSYLVSTSYNILCSSLFKYLLSDTILLKFDFWYCASKIQRVRRMELNIYLLSHHYSFLKNVSSRRSEVSFIETLHPSYAHPFPLIVESEKRKSNFSSNNKSQPMIISYCECFCGSYTWKFHVTLSVASNYGRTNSALFLCVVRKSPPWVLHLTVWVFLLHICLCVFLILSKSLPWSPVEL